MHVSCLLWMFVGGFVTLAGDRTKVDEYLHSTQDGDSKLWRTIPQNVNQTLILLDRLSFPLLVAKDPETGELWFLTQH